MFCEELKQISGGKFEVNENNIIGDGAFCNVYECKNGNLEYVVKIVKNEDKEEFKKEINVFNKIQKHRDEFLGNKKKGKGKSNKSSKIIELINWYCGKEYTYIILEKMDINLFEFIKVFSIFFKSRVPFDIITFIIKSICEGLNELNFNNLMHADLKLDNIMVRSKHKTYKSMIELFDKYDQFLSNANRTTRLNNLEFANQFLIDNMEIKIIDLNKVIFINEIYKSLNIQTLYFQSPEIALGNRKYNQSIDIWSLGCIIWCFLTDHDLFDVYNLKTKHPDFNLSYRDCIMDKHPKESEYSDVDSNDTNSNISSSNSSRTNSNNTDSTLPYNHTFKKSDYITTNYYSDYTTNKRILENYHYFNILFNYFGHIPKNLIIGENVDYYFYNNMLMGSVFNRYNKIDLFDILKNEIQYFSLDNLTNPIYNEQDLINQDKEFRINKIKTFITNISSLLQNNIFLYDSNKRITVKKLLEILSNI